MPDSGSQSPQSRSPYVVVAGYGLPGRTIVELLRQRGIPHRVIELNPQTCQRVAAGGVDIVVGDAADIETLRRAGVEQATLVALMVPEESVVLKSVSLVRSLNPTAHIIARCAYTSAGLEAARRGANDTIVAEQVVARELSDWPRDCCRSKFRNLGALDTFDAAIATMIKLQIRLQLWDAALSSCADKPAFSPCKWPLRKLTIEVKASWGLNDK